MNSPTDLIQELAEANQVRQVNDQANVQNQHNARIEQGLFDAFKAITDVVQGQQSTAEAVSKIINTLDSLGGSVGNHDTQMKLLESGLDELHKQLEEVPVGDLKQLPKFLKTRDKVQVTNLDELSEQVGKVEAAVKSLKLDVKAPDVNVQAPDVTVPAPVVNVPETDLKPLLDAVQGLKTALKPAKQPEVVKTEQTNQLITEKFDSWKIVYSDFDEESTRVEAIKYYQGRKLVATLTYAYNDDGDITGVKKT